MSHGQRTSSWLIMSLLGLVLAAWGLRSEVVMAQPPEPHQYIQEYTGPATCEMCHPGIVDDVIHTVHYTWDEKMDHYSPIPGTIARINWLGMLNEDLNIPGGCGRCHIGAGSRPVAPQEATAADKAEIDCLICHSPNYDVSLRFPTKTEEGEWVMTQDRSLSAARNAQRPTAENCLRCHFNVGGGPLLKRGVDFAPIADKHGENSKGDVHAEAGMTCVDCHSSDKHQVMGYGPTLWSRDLPDQRLQCQACHGDEPHENVLLNSRHARLDCRTCHITGTGGLVSRDWTAEPAYDPVNELYWPVSDVREANSVPLTYRWFDGEPARPGQPWPGERTDENSKIQPFKRYDAIVPVDADSGQPIPLKLGVYFTQGDLEKAISAGAQDSGIVYSGSWQPKEVTALLQTSHGVVSKQDALYCQDCHVPNGRMDFAALGYTPDEVALLTSLSSPEAGVRPALHIQVVMPASEPLPAPQSLSGEVDVYQSPGARIGWSPLLAGLAAVIIIVAAGAWMWRQRPQQQNS